ncbi:MAG: hypothetical protein AAB887_00825 [Patescibacteria group bacterium]
MSVEIKIIKLTTNVLKKYSPKNCPVRLSHINVGVSVTMFKTAVDQGHLAFTCQGIQSSIVCPDCPLYREATL